MTLKRREYEALESEQRKNDLVVFLAHDLKTPLTSIIAYLTMLDEQPQMPASEAPMGFWTDLVAAVRKELKPPAAGFFVASPNAPIQGAVVGDKLELRCSNNFTKETIDKPHVLEVVTRKASAMLGRPVRTSVVDMSARAAGNPRMEQLMNFGRNHSDVVKIKQH